MKIHEWLAELHPHEIYDHHGAAADFREKVGLEPVWPTHTVAATRDAIEAKGFGGQVRGAPDQLMAYGWEIAESLSETYATSTAFNVFAGRGPRFRVAVEALQAAGV